MSEQCEIILMDRGRMVLRFNFASPSQNKIEGIVRSSRKCLPLRWIWKQKFMRSMKNYSLIKRAKKKKIISITRVVDKVQKKLKDYGNLVGGCKPLLDALKTSGFIVDDSEKWIKDTYKQLVTSENATYVDIRDEGYL